MNRRQRFAKNMLELSNRSQARNTADYCEKAMPYLYSAMALALHKRGWGAKRIGDLFADTEKIWCDYADSGMADSMMEICLKETGIAIMNRTDAIEKGIINENS